MELREEAEYRVSLARSNLRDSGRFLKARLYHWAVLSAQMSVENSAEAVISCFRIPSWLHDPSTELEDLIDEWAKDILGRFGEGMVKRLRALASAASELAPEHGRATYGVVERRLLPEEMYDEGRASRALSLAEEAYETADQFVKRWFGGIEQTA